MSRLERLRAHLSTLQLDGVIVPITNAFQGEYSPEADKRLEWLTGFTGSNGLAIVLPEVAGFFTDGRYTLQAKREVDGEAYELLDFSDKAHEWLKSHGQPGQRIGYDPWLHTPKGFEAYQKSAKEGDLTLVPTEANVLDALWTDRPPAPDFPARPHPMEYAGKSSHDKRHELAEELRGKRLAASILSAGDSICWLLNVRGSDLPHTPFLLAYAILYADATVDLFYAPEKCRAIAEHLGEEVRVHPLSALQDRLAGLAKKRVQVDPKRVSAWFFERLAELDAEVVEEQDPCQKPKALKNDIELQGAREAHIRDGLAMARFLCWFDQRAHLGQETELTVARKLGELRAALPLFQEPSFETISGFGPNGAIIHYRVTEETCLPLQPDDLYLVDSGGQFLDGTTDITRTLPVGTPTATHIEHFTLVLKGMIQLTLAQFPKGTGGGQLDLLARQALWQAGLDYNHGTGHGIGSYLSVHEGPQGISHRAIGTKLLPGMLLSNEPGYYKTDGYGIRIENVIAVVELGVLQEGEKEFYGFDTLTLAPIDRRLIDPSLLSPKELRWLNQYHKRVYDTLHEHLQDEAQTLAWLEQATAPL